MFDLVCMNDGTPTLLSCSRDHANVLDLVLCTADLVHLVQCTTIGDTLGSDHFPVHFSLRKQYHRKTKSPSLSSPFNFAKAKWDIFAAHVQDCFRSELVSDYESFLKVLEEAARMAIPHKRKSSTVNYCPWWDESCTRLIKLRKFLIGQFLSSGSRTSFVIAKRYIALCKKHLLRKKRESFKTFCENLSRETSISDIWSTIRRFRNAPHQNNFVGESNKDWTPDFMSSLCPDYVPSREELEPFMVESSDSEIAAEFSKKELYLALDTPKNTSPGSGLIAFPMLKNIPDEAKEFLLKAFNDILRGAKIPAHWSDVLIVPIPKRGKDANRKEGYRPIALINCDRKVLEKMILTRLEWWFEHHSLLEPLQFGFRRGMGVPECLFSLVGMVQTAFLRRRVLVALFADIESAYDNVNIPTMLRILADRGVPSNVLELLRQLIAFKTLRLKNDPLGVGSRMSFRGLPQGSPLSPLLFNIYVSGLNKILLRFGVRVIWYADDVVFICEAKSVEAAVAGLNEAMKCLHAFLEERHLSLSLSKSKAVIFSRRRKAETIPNIVYNDSTINFTSNIKYLGVHLNSKLSWAQHANEVSLACGKALNILQSLSSTRWGCSTRISTMIYKALIRSRLDYCTWIMSPMPKKVFYKLQKIQFRAARFILGALNSTPTNVLLVEMNEVPLPLRLNASAEKFIIKNHTTRPNPIATMLLTLHTVYEGERVAASRIPLAVTAFARVAPLLRKMKRTSILNTYRRDFTQVFFSPEVTLSLRMYSDIKNLTGQLNTNSMFMEEVTSLWPGFIIFFTDGSVKSDPLYAGFGVHAPSLNLSFAARVSSHLSIFTVELLAIVRALKFVEERDIQQAIIFSDSLSAITAIMNYHGLHVGGHYLVYQIVEMAWQRRCVGSSVEFCWVPGHADIVGNEIADRLAGRAEEGSLVTPLDDPQDIMSNIKAYTIQCWQTQWDVSSRTRGRIFRLLKPRVDFPSWFDGKGFIPKHFTSTICRLRSGHGLFQSHLYRMGLQDSPSCSCGHFGDLNHFFFGCPNYEFLRVPFFKGLLSLGIQSPYNLTTLLATNSFSVYKLMYSFMLSCDFYI